MGPNVPQILWHLHCNIWHGDFHAIYFQTPFGISQQEDGKRGGGKGCESERFPVSVMIESDKITGHRSLTTNN